MIATLLGLAPLFSPYDEWFRAIALPVGVALDIWLFTGTGFRTHAQCRKGQL